MTNSTPKLKLPTLTQIKMFGTVVGAWLAIVNAYANTTDSPPWLRAITAAGGALVLAVDHAYNKQTTAVTVDALPLAVTKEKP